MKQNKPLNFNYIFLKFLTEPTIWLKGCSIYYYLVIKIILQEGCVVCKVRTVYCCIGRGERGEKLWVTVLQSEVSRNRISCSNSHFPPASLSQQPQHQLSSHYNLHYHQYRAQAATLHIARTHQYMWDISIRRRYLCKQFRVTVFIYVLTDVLLRDY